MNLALNETLSPPLPAWRAYIERTVGFVLPKSQENWLSCAIVRLARDHKMSCACLYKKLDDPVLSQALIDAVLIKDSRFFRDPKAEDAIACAFAKHRQTKQSPFLLMSIGTATGQEAWSAAMVLHKTDPVGSFCVVGVDASTKALTVASQGRYPLKDKAQIPSDYECYVSKREGDIQVQPILRRHVRFVACNVFLAEQMQACLQEFYGQVDFLICQNMLIYFRKFDQRDLLARFSQLLATDGQLLLGASEALFWQTTQLQRVAKDSNLWQKLGTL